MSSPSFVRCKCGNTVFVLRTGHCAQCGEVFAGYKASSAEIEQEQKRARQFQRGATGNTPCLMTGTSQGEERAMPWQDMGATPKVGGTAGVQPPSPLQSEKTP